MTFDIFQSVSRKGQVCTQEVFETSLQSPSLAPLLAQIASETDDNRRAKLKKQLPVITWQAHFPGGRRLNSDAVPSGLFMVDIDHVDDPDALYRDTVQPHIEELGIVVVHKTPSTHGLRIVARCRPDCDGLAANQQFIADALGLTIDTVCKDYARSSFLVTRDYFYHIDESIWKGASPQPSPVGRESNAADSPAANTAEGGLPPYEGRAGGEAPSLNRGEATLNQAEGAETGGEASMKPNYLGISYAKIIQTWWRLHNNGQEPVKSNRDTLTFELACNLRHICGFNRDLLDKVIPCYDGFPEAEKLKCIDSALKEKITRMPARLQQVLNVIKSENTDNAALVAAMDEAEEQDEQFYIDRIPDEALPMGVRDSLEGVSRTMAMPVLVGIGPMIGALATDVRLDVHGVSKRLNLMAYIVGEAASNKSQLDALYLTWMHDLIEQDRINHAIEDEYLESVRRKKNSKEQPKDPHVLIRCESLRTSIAQLINRLRNNQGKHLYSYTSEADQLSQNNGGSWSNLSVLIRSAYDNSKFDTDYANGQSTGVVIDNVLWNMTICCTPDALYRAHRNYTNGAVTRLAIARTPDNTFAPLSVGARRTAKAEENIGRVASLLQRMKGDVVLPKLEERCAAWLERIRLETLKNDDRVRARLRMRAAVTAMRYTCCFMLCAYAEWLLRKIDDNHRTRAAWTHGCETAADYLDAHPDLLSENLRQFQTEPMLTLFDVLADYIIDMLNSYFGERIAAAYDAVDYRLSERSRNATNDSIFNRLPNEFSFDDARLAKGLDATPNAARMMVKNWKRQGLIQITSRGCYKKLVATPSDSIST